MNKKNVLIGVAYIRGYTQKTLAEAIGISPQALNNKLNGVRSFYKPEIEKIGEVLELTDQEIKEIFEV